MVVRGRHDCFHYDMCTGGFQYGSLLEKDHTGAMLSIILYSV